MSTQPEAMRLAESLEADFKSDTHNFDDMIQAASELRRLHALNHELLEALKLAAEINPYGSVENAAARDAARAAIAKATGGEA